MHILNKTITKANGKIVICDFKSLNSTDFLPFCKRELMEEIMLIAPDGKIYLNARMKESNYVADIFNEIIQASQYTLDQYCKMFKKKYSDITFENVFEMKGTDVEKTQAFLLLCIPIEIQRRKIERNYYYKTK